MFKSFNKEILSCFTTLVKVADSQAKTNERTLSELRDAIAQERAGRMTAEQVNVHLERELAAQRANFDWLKAKVNQLEYERAALLQQTSNVSIPVPEIMQRPPTNLPDQGAFEDVGDRLAQALNLDQFGDQGDS